MAATLLSMSQRVARDAGYPGTLQSVDVATGDAARIVDYVRSASLYVESKWGDWRFLWGGLMMGTVIKGDPSIAAPVGHYRWDENRMFFGPSLVTPEMWHNFTMYEGMNRESYPTNFVIMPDSSVNIYPRPDRNFDYSFSWYREPKALVNNDDEPLVPDRFRDVIVAYALWLYAMYDDAAELAAKANAEYEKWLYVLEADQRPDGYSTNQSSGNHITISTE